MENPQQLNFIQKLKQSLPPNISLADELTQILKLSQDSAYRRMRGETAMSIDEAVILCNHYKIPISHFTEETPGLVTFKYLPPEPKREVFYNHLEALYKTTDGLLDFEDRKIIYGAIDAPLFYHFGFEHLAIFKMHFWMHAINGIPGFKDFYDENDVDRDLVKLSKKIHEGYMMIPSEEIWQEDILLTSLMQLEYYVDFGYFKNHEDALNIIHDLHQLINLVEQMAECSHKLKPGDKSKQQYASFHLYHSDVLLGNNTVIAIGNERKTTFLSHMTFHAMSTMNETYSAHAETWMRRIINKSTLISGSSEKVRTKFFRKLRSYIDNSAERIKKEAVKR